MTEKLKPDWAGENLLSQVVNALIQTKPIYGLMKQQARKVLIKTAEKNGIPWRQTVQRLQEANLQPTFAAIANSTLDYPDYYTVPFHAYDQGNLCWLAAFEAEPATYAMALRVWREEALSWEVAQERLRSSFLEVVAQHLTQPVGHILDMGCSVGISTLAVHRYIGQCQPDPVQTVGLDLSPYMLAVAQARDSQHDIQAWIHGNAEATPFLDQSFDLITLQFVIHELPRTASQNVFKEARRLLRGGGCLAIVDNNPKSAVIQNLPPVLFTLMKSTEPWSDDYYTFDVETALEAAGFRVAAVVASDPRHRTLIAKPAS